MSVRELKSGKPRKHGEPRRWEIHVKTRGPDGALRVYRHHKTFQSRSEAKRFENAIRNRIHRGEPIEATKKPTEAAPTLEAWVEILVSEYSCANHLRPSTIGEQRRMFRLYLLPILGASTRIDRIRTPHFDAVRNAIKARGLSAKTSNNATGVLSRAVKYFYQRQGLPVPHFDSCRVKVTKGLPNFWEPEQYEALVQAATDIGPRELAMLLLMGDCGLRSGEVIALEWSHVRWKPTPLLLIQRAHWRGHFGPPKGGRPRTVPMTTRTAEALRALPRSLGVPWVLTRTYRGELTHESHSSQGCAIGRVERAIGHGKPGHRAHLHKLRHSFVTRLSAAGVPPLTIRDLAGHTRIETTMRYMHALDGAGSRAVAALEAFDKQERSRSEATSPISGSAS